MLLGDVTLFLVYVPQQKPFTVEVSPVVFLGHVVDTFTAVPSE